MKSEAIFRRKNTFLVKALCCKLFLFIDKKSQDYRMLITQRAKQRTCLINNQIEMKTKNLALHHCSWQITCARVFLFKQCKGKKTHTLQLFHSSCMLWNYVWNHEMCLKWWKVIKHNWCKIYFMNATYLNNLHIAKITNLNQNMFQTYEASKQPLHFAMTCLISSLSLILI